MSWEAKRALAAFVVNFPRVDIFPALTEDGGGHVLHAHDNFDFFFDGQPGKFLPAFFFRLEKTRQYNFYLFQVCHRMIIGARGAVGAGWAGFGWACC